MTMFRRHDILQISDTGRKHAFMMAAWYNPFIEDTLLRHVIFTDIPAIVRAQENPRDGFLEVGFSSHLLRDGVRVRVKSEIPLNDITHVITPFDLIGRADDCRHECIRKSLEDITRLAASHGLDTGVYGSCAMELLTGMPYIQPTSDIDIIIKRRGTHVDFAGFYDAAMQVSQRHGTCFDIEVLCRNGSGVKLPELFSKGKTVMCKGLHGAELQTKYPLLMSFTAAP